MKDVRWLFCFALIFVQFASINCQITELKECLLKDSISCIQMQLFRNARELMNQESIDLVGGMSLVRSVQNTSIEEVESRSRKDQDRENAATELLELEEQVVNATDVLSRQEAIENFLVRKAREVVVERTIRWDIGQTIRNILNSIPLAIKAKFTNYVTEARGKGKKLLRFLIPLLIGLKLKMAGMSALTYLGIAVLAKKALLAALISLIVSGFIGLKKLLAAKQPLYEDIAPYYPPPTWATPNIAYGYDTHGTDLAAQKLAYNNHS